MESERYFTQCCLVVCGEERKSLVLLWSSIKHELLYLEKTCVYVSTNYQHKRWAAGIWLWSILRRFHGSIGVLGSYERAETRAGSNHFVFSAAVPLAPYKFNSRVRYCWAMSLWLLVFSLCTLNLMTLKDLFLRATSLSPWNLSISAQTKYEKCKNSRGKVEKDKQKMLAAPSFRR